MGNNRARSFVTIMIIISLFALFLRIAIEEIMRINIAQNESSAQITLKLISTALENYSKDNRGVFPVSLSSLTTTNPPYLGKDYIIQYPVKGYNYSCPRLEPSGYNCIASPVRCKITGKTTYTITTGGSLTTDECVK